MTIDPKFEGCLKWFKGKTLENAKVALAMLTEADALGYWPPNYSRKVRAALNKQAIAEKLARAWEKSKILEDLSTGDEKPFGLRAGWLIVHEMRFGNTGAATAVSGYIAAIKRNHPDLAAEAAEALETAYSWAKDMFEAGAVMTRLDATRPKPIYFMKTLSKTVLENVSKAMGIALETLQMPEIIMVKRLGLDPKTKKKIFVWEPEIKWPEGTMHWTSKYCSRGCYTNCHACGHRIYNAFNWVPLLAYTGPNNTGPVSLWVGSDCAKNLFGCDVKNGVEFKTSPEKAAGPKTAV